MKFDPLQNFLKIAGRFFIAGFCVLLISSCSWQSATIAKLPPFSVTNIIVDGELRQVLQTSNGMEVYFTQSNVVVWFCKGSDTVIGFDPKTLKPLSILFETPPIGDQPGQSIFDLNADGVPDVGEIKDTGKTQLIFYHGEWYLREKEGNHSSITINGIKQNVHYDGRRWLEVTN